MAAGTGMSTSQRGKAMTQTPMAGRTRTRMERGEEEEEEGSKWWRWCWVLHERVVVPILLHPIVCGENPDDAAAAVAAKNWGAATVAAAEAGDQLLPLLPQIGCLSGCWPCGCCCHPSPCTGRSPPPPAVLPPPAALPRSCPIPSTQKGERGVRKSPSPNQSPEETVITDLLVPRRVLLWSGLAENNRSISVSTQLEELIGGLTEQLHRLTPDVPPDKVAAASTAILRQLQHRKIIIVLKDRSPPSATDEASKV